jgi:hypothetical protein
MNPEARMRPADDAAPIPNLSPDDRLRAVARILAQALLRRRDRPMLPSEPGPKILSESGTSDLE